MNKTVALAVFAVWMAIVGLWLIFGSDAPKAQSLDYKNAPNALLSASAPEWVVLQTQNANSSSAITFTQLSGFTRYKLTYSNVVFSTTGAVTAAQMQFSTNGGTSYVTSGYQWNLQTAYGTNTWASTSSASDSAIKGVFYGYNSTDGVNGELLMYNFGSSSLYNYVYSSFGGFNASDSPASNVLTGNLNSTTTVNAVKLVPASGTFASGKFTLWGSTY